jgi:hypothetical protein
MKKIEKVAYDESIDIRDKVRRIEELAFRLYGIVSDKVYFMSMDAHYLSGKYSEECI